MSVSKDMADPDLQIRGGGGGGDGLQKIFLALWASVWSKNMGAGGAGPPGPSPGSITGTFWAIKLVKPI